MPLFRLLINNQNNNIIVEYPDKESLIKHINDPFHIGYHLNEILTAMASKPKIKVSEKTNKKLDFICNSSWQKRCSS